MCILTCSSLSEPKLSGVRSLIECSKAHLIAPGSTVTIAPTMVVATGNTLVSKTFHEPPASGVEGACESLYVNGLGTVPAGSEGA